MTTDLQARKSPTRPRRNGRITFLLAPLLLGVSLLGWAVHDVNRQQRNRDLIAAIKRYDATGVERLLQAGADPDTTDRPFAPVTWQQVLTDLLDRMRPNQKSNPGSPALLVVLGEDQRVSPENATDAKKILTSLLNHGAHLKCPNPVPVDRSVLKPVIDGGLPQADATLVKLLLEHGADPNERDMAGTVPLFYTTSPAIIETLISHGADVNATDKDGTTSLHAMCISNSNNADAIECLIRHGAKLEARDTEGNTPLLCAVKSDFIGAERIEILTKYGADVNVQDVEAHASALMEACEGGSAVEAEALLKHGARPNLRDKQGHTALWHAAHTQNTTQQLKTLLAKAGATM